MTSVESDAAARIGEAVLAVGLTAAAVFSYSALKRWKTGAPKLEMRTLILVAAWFVVSVVLVISGLFVLIDAADILDRF